MSSPLRLLCFLALSLGLGASAAHAATNPYAGTYTIVYVDHKANGNGEYGTFTVSSTGAITVTTKIYVGGSFGQQLVLHGTVSPTGAVSIPFKNKITVNFLQQSGIVLGLTGTVAPGGVFVGVRKPT